MSGFFSEDLLDDIRSANSIYDVVSQHLSLKKSGKNYKGLCPFHAEKTPSFTVNTEKQIFHCFGCGEGGNVFRFIMKQQGMTFPEAVRTLAKMGGVSIPETLPRLRSDQSKHKDRLLAASAAAMEWYRKNLVEPQGRQAMAYLLDRKITRATGEAFSLGYAPPAWDGLLRVLRAQGFTEAELLSSGLIVTSSRGGHIDRFRSRVIFPIRDLQGQVVGFGGRIVGKGEPKYLNSPETPLYNKSKILYGLSQAREHIRKEGFGVVVEGYFDCLSAAQEGVGNVVATSGTALTEGHLRLMRRHCERWTIVFDGDAAGIRAATRSLELFVSEGMFARAVLIPEGEDPDTFIRTRGSDAFRRLLAEAESLMDFFMGRTVRDYPVKTVEGKVAALRVIAPILAKVKGGVEREEYIGRAAHLLDVKEQVLRSEIRALSTGDRKTATRSQHSSFSPRNRPAEEVGIIKAMLASDDVAVRIRKEVSLEDLEDKECRAVARRVFALLDEGVTEGIGKRLQFEDEQLNSLVASWMIDPENLTDGPTALQEARDCLTRIRQRRLDSESRLLQNKIAQAEKAGNKEVLYALLKMKQGLRLRAE